MATERELQMECAKLQAAIQKAEDGIRELQRRRDQIEPQSVSAKNKAIEAAETAFRAQKSEDKVAVQSAIASLRERVEEFLDSCPDLDAKEFAGRYEIKDLEAKLCEVYPADFVEHYVCVNPIDFDDETEAYQVYASAEQHVNSLKQRNIAAALFSGLTGLMEGAAGYGNIGSKIVLVLIGLLLAVTLLQPFLILGLFTFVGAFSAIHGRYVGNILRQLFSVKEFLNDEYDEDIFQQDKGDIMEGVDEFLEGVEQDYIEEIDSREFHQPTKEINQIVAQAQREVQAIDNEIVVKMQNINNMKAQAASTLAEYEKAVEERKQVAANARKKYLGTFDWKSEWFATIFLDVNSEDKVVGCQWTQQNTLFIAKSIDPLQTFSQLAIFQNVLHVHPSFAGQVVIDYKYMGGNLLPFSRLPACVIDICVEPEKIEKKMTSLNIDVRARCNNILQSCASIEDFNKLMETYGVTGETYVTLHLFGLSALTAEQRMILKNGPKVGYFTKIYTTLEELQGLSKDFPFDDVPEYLEVSDKVVYRTGAQVQRLLSTSA